MATEFPSEGDEHVWLHTRKRHVEGEVGEEHYGKIDGYIGKWELVESIHISSIVDKYWVCGLISDDEICLRDVKHNIYVTNIRTKHTEKVIEGDPSMDITSCAHIDSNLIVFGKQGRFGITEDSLDGCIALYDRQWKVIRDINMPRNSEFFSEVYVDVNTDGMILATQYDNSHIFVINPDDGNIVNTITMQTKEVKGDIQALSSGDIVVKSGAKEFTVISRSGEEKAVINCDEWRASQCRVDKLTDTLYITYWGTDRTIIVVDQVSCNGIIQARRIVEYKRLDRRSVSSPCLVTPSGDLVGLDGTNLLVYKKIYSV